MEIAKTGVFVAGIQIPVSIVIDPGAENETPAESLSPSGKFPTEFFTSLEIP